VKRLGDETYRGELTKKRNVQLLQNQPVRADNKVGGVVGDFSQARLKREFVYRDDGCVADVSTTRRCDVALIIVDAQWMYIELN